MNYIKPVREATCPYCGGPSTKSLFTKGMWFYKCLQNDHEFPPPPLIDKMNYIKRVDSP